MLDEQWKTCPPERAENQCTIEREFGTLDEESGI
jgi:hypothetical protein